MAFLLKRKEDLTSTVYKIFTYKKTRHGEKFCLMVKCTILGLQFKHHFNLSLLELKQQ